MNNYRSHFVTSELENCNGANVGYNVCFDFPRIRRKFVMSCLLACASKEGGEREKRRQGRIQQ